MTNAEFHRQIRLKSHDNSFHAFGMKYIFDKRIKKYSQWLGLLKVFGIVVPATVGATVLGNIIGESALAILIGIAAFVTVVQFVFSVFAVIYKWDDELFYSFEASQEYGSLSTSFQNLGQFPPDDLKDLNHQFDILMAQYNSRSSQDTKHNVKDSELRMGMRFSLREHKKECSGCKVIPLDMESTNCSICGNF